MQRMYPRFIRIILILLGIAGLSAGTIVAYAPVSKAAVHKTMVIVEENHDRTQAMSGMPYLASLASQYGQATGYNAVTHPSLPNYLAIGGGSTFSVTDDNGPSSHPLSGASVFGQTVAAGGTAKTYAESMTSNCQLTSSGNYAVKHNEWPYFSDASERSACNTGDVPSGTTTSGNLLNDINNGNLPVTGHIIPNLCNDAHDCTLATANTWLQNWMTKILAGPDYVSGNLTVIITFDEGTSTNNNVAFVVVDPRLNGVGKTVTGAYNHYALTRWLDDNAGVAPLRNAASAGDLRAAFGLGGASGTQQPPTSVTGAASNITSTSATLSGTVNPNGASTTCSFDYGKTTGYGGHTATVSAGSGSASVSVTGTPSGLTPGSLYHYRLGCTNSGGTTYGLDNTFTTLGSTQQPPTVTTGAAADVTDTTATLNGTVNPNGAATNCLFNYGQSTNYGGNTATVDAGAGTTSVAVTGTPSGLQPSALYHYRLSCTNSGGTSNGADATFTTAAAPNPNCPTTGSTTQERDLISAICNVPADAQYGLHDSGGNSMDGMKVISTSGGTPAYVAVYQNCSLNPCQVVLGSSSDLRAWTFERVLSTSGSAPTIKRLTDGTYLMAYESSSGGSHLAYKYYPDLASLLTASSSATYDAPDNLGSCQGTPNIYSPVTYTNGTLAGSLFTIGFHWSNCAADQQATGKLTGFNTWCATDSTWLNTALRNAGAAGKLGDRDSVWHGGQLYDVVEGNLTSTFSWANWRLFAYGFTENSAVQIPMHTAGGSTAFANPSVTALTGPDGTNKLVISVYIPSEGAATGETGELLYTVPDTVGTSQGALPSVLQNAC